MKTEEPGEKGTGKTSSRGPRLLTARFKACRQLLPHTRSRVLNLLSLPPSSFTLFTLLLCLALHPAPAPAQRRPARAKAPAARHVERPASAAKTPAATAARAVTVRTEPRAGVWLDGLRRGTTDESGQLVINHVAPGRHTLRVRAAGFAERSLPLLPAQRGTVEVKLTPTTDEAELAFQQAEDAREGVVRPGAERPDPAALYRRALELRPRFPAAHVGLARVLLGRDQYDEALEQIKEARLDRPVYPEASAVEGRILRATADYEAALEAYRRAVREGRGVQPEAYAGMGIVYEEQGKYDEAVAAFNKAIAQLQDTEPALYQLLGAAYEKLERWRDAVNAYEKYLQLAPEGRLAPAVRSIIDQLRQQAAEQEAQPNARRRDNPPGDKPGAVRRDVLSRAFALNLHGPRPEAHKRRDSTSSVSHPRAKKPLPPFGATPRLPARRSPPRALPDTTPA